MNHLILFFACVFWVELFVRFNYISLVDLTIKELNRAVKVILNKKISDHWKEIIIPIYSMKAIKYSIQIIISTLVLISFFYILGRFFNQFIENIFSFFGIFESIIFSILYLKIRRQIFR